MTYLDTDVLDELLEILGDEDLRSITDSFVEQLGHQLTALDTQLEQTNFAEIARIAHSLKGGAGNLGAIALSETAAALERHAREGDADMTSSVMTTLPELARQTVAELSERGYASAES
ncbi:Hpt domain-containing protein [Thiocystis violascens]|uniref:HPt domain-containing protein n=1 Tax=Thiocystis violascens (strain ATCC 17096 / DSM 198 / 6111) TaxID=765911 RepID=I3Y6T5_THIV6|nr:Hpt domain-containing protein [Thiocystis violascens]AFL72703.1 HPt domain-containing protein [Thiocystis violascens DSM 198]